MTASFSLSKADCCGSPHVHNTPDWVSSRSGFVISDNRGRNLARYCTVPNSLCTPSLSVGEDRRGSRPYRKWLEPRSDFPHIGFSGINFFWILAQGTHLCHAKKKTCNIRRLSRYPSLFWGCVLVFSDWPSAETVITAKWLPVSSQPLAKLARSDSK